MASRRGQDGAAARDGAAAGSELARLNAFSDGVFALSATLLVVTLEVPSSYDALLDALRGFPAFFLGFAALVSLWFNHREFFARYRLGDGWTVALNGLLRGSSPSSPSSRRSTLGRGWRASRWR